MRVKEKNFASAVIYVHNAEKRIDQFLQTIIRVMEENFEHSEIICVNDDSTDESVSVIRQCASRATSTSVAIINMSYFHGIELSMNAGMDLAIGDFVFEFDNTILDFNPDVIMEIYHRALEGYDIVTASADRKEKLSSHLFYYVFEKFAHLQQDMTTESFRVLSRRVINRISSMNKTIPYRKAIYANCGLQTDLIRYAPLAAHKEKKDRQEHQYRSSLAMDSLLMFTDVGYRFSMTMTVIMMFMSIFMVCYSIITYLVAHPVEGWTTTILFLSVSFFGLFGILTIVVKYLQLLVDMTFRRKHYSFTNIEKLTK